MNLSILITAIWSSQLFVVYASSLGKDTNSCTKERDFGILHDNYNSCSTVSEMEYTYCEGSCGDITAKPLLLQSLFVSDDQMVVDNNSMPHLCRTCGKSFASSSGLSDHERRHDNKAPYRCCGHGFYSRANFLRHRCSAHGEERLYQCDKCSTKFALEGDLNRHKAREECLSGQYICDTCGADFRRLGDFREHQDKHTGNKGFMCECGKTYRYHTSLSRHKKTCPTKTG